MEDGQNKTDADPYIIPDVSVDSSTDRIAPNQVQTGVSRGTTTTITNTDGSYVTLGLIPDGGTDFGIAYFTPQGNLIMKDTGVTTYKYDSTGRNYYQNGLLPDGTYGEVITKAPYNVSDAVVTD